MLNKKHLKYIIVLSFLLPRCSTPHTMHTAPVVPTGRIRVLVTSHIRHESALIQQGMLQRTRADPNLRGKVLQETISSKPVVAKGVGPALTVESFPLRGEVPTQRNRSTP